MMTDKQVLEKSSNMTNIERVAEHIARCQHREKVKAAVSYTHLRKIIFICCYA